MYYGAPLTPSHPGGTTDDEVHYSRITFSGKLERDAMQTTSAQLLHKALELRQSYNWHKGRELGRSAPQAGKRFPVMMPKR